MFANHTHQPIRNGPKPNDKINIPSYAMVRCLELQKSSYIYDFLKAGCVKSILLHILFSRGVIPCPAQHLLDKVQVDADVTSSNMSTCSNGDVNINVSAENKENHYHEIRKNVSTKRTNTASALASTSTSAATMQSTRSMKRKRADIVRERKYQKHGFQIRSVLDDLDALFDSRSTNTSTRTRTTTCKKDQSGKERDDMCTRSTNSRNESGVKAVLITLGPSFQSPREQYLIRFHKWEQCEGTTNDYKIDNIPSSVQKRLQNEIGRRSLRELIGGTLEEEYSIMFEPRGGGVNGQNASIKVNVACLLEEHAIEKLFHHESSTSISTSMSTMPLNQSLGMGHFAFTNSAYGIVPSTITSSYIGNNVRNHQSRFTINRNLEVKQPRMFSKSRGIHRPFAVLDVIPKCKPPTHNDHKCNDCDDDDDDMDISLDDDEAAFSRQEGDTWISLRSYIKGFRA